MTRKMLFRRAVAGLAKEGKAAPHTSLTLTEALLKESLAENRRLRGEVRRLRRALRGVIPFIGYQACVPKLVEEAEAALAARRRSK